MDFTTETAAKLIGQDLVVSDWVTLTQDMVDKFADATKDPDWMHVDVARSERESPYGGTIVQGFLNMSLVIYFSHTLDFQPKDTVYGLNYGIDRARFLTPVRTGTRVRDHVALTGFTPRGEGRYLMKSTHTIEAEGEEKPAAVIDWLVLWFRDLES